MGHRTTGIAICLAGLILLAAGCSLPWVRSDSRVRPCPPVDWADYVADMAQAKGPGAFQALQGRGRVAMTRSGIISSGRAVWVVEQPDRFRVVVLTPFGTPVAVVASDGTTLTARITGEDGVEKHEFSRFAAKRAFGFPADSRELAALLSGRIPVREHSRVSCRPGDKGELVLSLESFLGAARQEIFVDTGRVTRTVIFSGDGDPAYEVVPTEDPDGRVLTVRSAEGPALTLTVGHVRAAEGIGPTTFDLSADG